MGDFEDVFGAGADIEAVIDGISAMENRRDINIEDILVEHQLWFPNFAAAEIWERAHPGTAFKRRPHLGGFEVVLTDWNSRAHYWQSSSEPYSSTTSGASFEPVELVYATGLQDRVVSYGPFCVSLAAETTSMLVGLLDRLRHEVPVARRTKSPIVLSKKQLRQFFRGMPESVSFDLDLGLGSVAIFCADHCLLVGRRLPRDEVAIWPWILEINCGGAKIDAGGKAACILCKHHDCDDGYNIPRNTHFDFEAFDFEHSAPAEHHHFIASKLYAGKITRTDLARCVHDWVALLSPLDAKMDATRRAPSNLIATKKETFAGAKDLQRICDALACVISIREKIESGVTVQIHSSTDLRSLPQVEPSVLTFSWKEGLGLFFNRKDIKSDIPDISGLDLTVAFPKWRDVVDLIPMERRPSTVSWGKEVISSGHFLGGNLTAQQKIAAEHLSQTLRESDIQPVIHDFLATCSS